MPLIVLLRGVNVGGHKTFRPSLLAKKLKHLDVVNVGAAGTFIVRKNVSQSRLRAEFARRLPFDSRVTICRASDIVKLLSSNPFRGPSAPPGVTRFVSFLSRIPRSEPRFPKIFPPRGRWLLKILARNGRFVFGLYRRDMKVIGYLGELDHLFDVPLTTRNWNTIAAIAKVLKGG